MTPHLDESIIRDIIRFAQNNDIQKVILFGSRARGDNHERSDIDLAVHGGNALDFYDQLNREAWTLLTFDVVNLDGMISPELQAEIVRDGVVIYEENR